MLALQFPNTKHFKHDSFRTERRAVGTIHFSCCDQSKNRWVKIMETTLRASMRYVSISVIKKEWCPTFLQQQQPNLLKISSNFWGLLKFLKVRMWTLSGRCCMLLTVYTTAAVLWIQAEYKQPLKLAPDKLGSGWEKHIIFYKTPRKSSFGELPFVLCTLRGINSVAISAAASTRTQGRGRAGWVTWSSAVPLTVGTIFMVSSIMPLVDLWNRCCLVSGSHTTLVLALRTA